MSKDKNNKKKNYQKPRCKRLFMEPEIKKHGKLVETIAQSGYMCDCCGCARPL